jgi:hypothetical protein
MIARVARTVSLICALMAAWSDARAADDKAWSTAEYGVCIHVAVDSAANPGIVDASFVPRLEQHIRRNLYPYWKSEITSHSGGQQSILLRQLDQLDHLKAEFETGADKTIYLTVTATGGGIHLACREHDVLTDRWTPVVAREVRQELILPQCCFELVYDTFAPRATVQIAPDNDQRAVLAFQGAELLSDVNKSLLTAPLNVFQPYLVRTSRSGASAGRVIEVPWTYLVTEDADGSSWNAEVYAGTRRPFGARRRAGVDIVALELKPVASGTQLRFHAGHDQSQALAGYEVFEKAADADEFQPAGFTDGNGSVRIARGDFPVTLVALRAEAQPLAQVPVAAGAMQELNVPVSDDVARLRVQESLTTFCEQMVDVVARRNILMARARDQLQKGKQKQAKDLLGQIGDLPTRANMDRYLATLERDPASHSENPRVQVKIDRLFADSRKMMSTYLTTRELLELEAEINSSASASE